MSGSGPPHRRRDFPSDILTRVREAPPVDTRYVAGRWHRDRLTWRGIWVEARVLGASVLAPRNRDVRKFLIVGRARSGTTLLTQLLNAHPDVKCDREVLAKSVLGPVGHLERLAAKSTARAYGAKLLSYQMAQVHRFRDPVGFLQDLSGRGFRFIHLTRDTFSQVVSLSTAQSRWVFHRSDGGPPVSGSAVDVEDFVRRLEWSDMLLEYERFCLADIPRARISYEEDLLPSERHQTTADRVFDWIGVPSAPVAAGLRKLLPEDPRAMIENYDEVARAVEARGLGRLLPG
jgi:LPS sulfotransferase NodH